MFKRLTTLAISSTLLIGLTACGGSGPDQPEASAVPSIQPTPKSAAELTPEAGAKLIVWDSYEEKEFIEAVALKFKEQYGVKVRFGELNPNKAMEQMAAEGPAGVGADVFASTQDHLETGVKKKLLRPVDLHKEIINRENDSQAIKGASYSGKLYGFPSSFNVAAVYYNKDLIESVPSTWSSMIEFAQGFNDPATSKYAIMWNVGNSFWNYGFFGGYDVTLFGNKGTNTSNIALNNANSVQAGNYYRSLRDALLPLRTEQLTEPIKQKAFVNKKIAMAIGDTTNISYFKVNVPNLATAPLPKLPNGQAMKPFSTVKSYYINANSKFPNAARMFAAYLTNAEHQKLNFTMTGAIPTNETVFNDAIVKNDPIAYGFLMQLKDSQATPGIDEFDAYLDAMNVALPSMWNDQLDANIALKKAVTDMKQLISRKK